MQVLKITALQRLSHGRLNLEEGQSDKIEAGEARELEKAGLVNIGGDEADETESLLGKMEPPVQNKMAKAPSNKSKE